MFVYIICRNIYLKDSVIDKLKAKLVILSVFDIYHEVYDYGNDVKIATVMADLYDRMANCTGAIITNQIKQQIEEAANKKSYEFE